jgi:hypothetical protein
MLGEPPYGRAEARRGEWIVASAGCSSGAGGCGGGRKAGGYEPEDWLLSPEPADVPVE